MMVNVVVTEDGTLKVKNKDSLSVNEFQISADIHTQPESAGKSNVAKILELFEEGDKMEFPRKTHEELMRELREMRE